MSEADVPTSSGSSEVCLNSTQNVETIVGLLSRTPRERRAARARAPPHHTSIRQCLRLSGSGGAVATLLSEGREAEVLAGVHARAAELLLDAQQLRGRVVCGG